MPPEGSVRSLGAAGQYKWMIDLGDLIPGSLGPGGRAVAMFVMASSPAAGHGAQRWRVRLDHVPEGIEESISQVRGVNDAFRQTETSLELQVAHGASVVATLDLLCRERGASIAAVDSVPWSDPVFGDVPSAIRLPVATALEVALAHSVTMSGRRLFGGAHGADLLRARAFLSRAATASGLAAYRLQPGALATTADLIEDLAGL
jgi:hypothetical protein